MARHIGRRPGNLEGRGRDLTGRIHIVGAAGSGATTLGRAVATALGVPHHDTDDYLWLPSDPPYGEWRDRDERLALMRAIFIPRPDWVLSGSMDGWDAGLDGMFDLVVFLRAPTDVRVARLRNREARRLGTDKLPLDTEDFVEWAAQYDSDAREGRSLQIHLAWLATLTCPVLTLDGTQPVATLTAEVLAAL